MSITQILYSQFLPSPDQPVNLKGLVLITTVRFSLGHFEKTPLVDFF